jgi:hypothetical protein
MSRGRTSVNIQGALDEGRSTVKSLLYLVAILASFFILLLCGTLAGGVILYPAGTAAALLGATAGAAVGVCVWFKLVGYFVELENIHLSSGRSPVTPEAERPADPGPALSSRDVRRGNHLMACGVVTFFSSLFSSPGMALLVGTAGIVSIVAGFIISLTAAEFPSEDGILRRVKLLATRARA